MECLVNRYRQEGARNLVALDDVIECVCVCGGGIFADLDCMQNTILAQCKTNKLRVIGANNSTRRFDYAIKQKSYYV